MTKLLRTGSVYHSPPPSFLYASTRSIAFLLALVGVKSIVVLGINPATTGLSAKYSFKSMS